MAKEIREEKEKEKKIGKVGKKKYLVEEGK